MGRIKNIFGQEHDKFNIYLPHFNEWSALINRYYGEIIIEPRIIVIPIIFYTLLLSIIKIINYNKDITE
jgi:peptide/nickel transport system permease protein